MKKNLLRSIPLALSLLLFPTVAHAANGWDSWWLPKTYSTHAPAMDSLFTWIFWITTVTFIGVQVVLIFFLIKYRYNPNKKKAVFSHGNQRLEMAWTIAPAIILLMLSVASVRVWNNYRYSPMADSPDKVTILVIGQQFQWNTIYPGPDGKLGRYLVYPKPTDTKWPDPRPADQRKNPYLFPEGKAGVPGPAFLPYEAAVKAINNYNELNPQGKDFSDPAGADDIYQGALAREIILPANRPVEVQLSSKDVIHDFYLPNFRVKLDAVPGMRGVLYFEGTTTSRSREMEAENRKTYTVDELAGLLEDKEVKAMSVDIDEKSPSALFDAAKKQWRYVDAKKGTIIRAGSSINKTALDKLKTAGITSVTLYKPGYWELVCEELCGQGHYKMRGQLRFVTSDEYDALGYDKPLAKKSATAEKPTTQPSVALGAIK